MPLDRGDLKNKKRNCIAERKGTTRNKKLSIVARLQQGGRETDCTEK